MSQELHLRDTHLFTASTVNDLTFFSNDDGTSFVSSMDWECHHWQSKEQKRQEDFEVHVDVETEDRIGWWDSKLRFWEALSLLYLKSEREWKCYFISSDAGFNGKVFSFFATFFMSELKLEHWPNCNHFLSWVETEENRLYSDTHVSCIRSVIFISKKKSQHLHFNASLTFTFWCRNHLAFTSVTWIEITI